MTHYNDVIMSAVASQITSLTIVYSTVYSGVDQRKHQSSASLAFVRGNHRRPVNSPHKWPVTRKMFPSDDVIMRSVLAQLMAWYVRRQAITWPKGHNEWNQNQVIHVILWWVCFIGLLNTYRYVPSDAFMRRKLTIIGSDNGLSPERRQAIIWTNAGMLLIRPLGANFREILIEIQTFSLKKIRLKMSAAKCCSFRLGLNVLKHLYNSRVFMIKSVTDWPDFRKGCRECGPGIDRRQQLQWRHNERDGASNHQLQDRLFNRLFRRRSKETSKLRVTGLCEANSPVTSEFPTQRASNTENVSIWWRHHGLWSAAFQL